MVYNHTGEWGYPYNLLGLDKSAYYMIDENGEFRNFTGCKNTVNTNHPATMALILASLRFWTEEMQVDGFRFDLASVLTRGQNGNVLKNPPILEEIARDFGMSPSGFHHHFKMVTDMSPIQFQRQIRLQEARRLMLGEEFDAASAGFRVGYEDPSHFSREYKKHFGNSPIRDVERLRALAVSGGSA